MYDREEPQKFFLTHSPYKNLTRIFFGVSALPVSFRTRTELFEDSHRITLEQEITGLKQAPPPSLLDSAYEAEPYETIRTPTLSISQDEPLHCLGNNCEHHYKLRVLVP